MSKAVNKLKWVKEGSRTGPSGEKVYKYKFVGWDGKVEKRLLSKTDKGKSFFAFKTGDIRLRNLNKLGKLDYKDLTKRWSNKNNIVSFGEGKDVYSIKEALNPDNRAPGSGDDFANHFLTDRQKDYYFDYGKTGNIPSDNVIEDIKEDEGQWRDFLQFGMGVKEDKLDKYITGDAKFGDLIYGEDKNITSQDIEDWSKGAMENYEFEGSTYDPTGGTALAEGQEFETPPDITVQQNPSADPRRSWIDEHPDLTREQKEDWSTKLDEIQAEEFKARETYSTALTGAGGYEEKISELEDIYKEEQEDIRGKGDVALEDLLRGKLEEGEDLRQAYGEGISETIGAEKELQRKTGFERGTTQDISGMVQEYSPEFSKQLEDYRQETGQTYQDVATTLDDLRQGYEQDIGDEITGVESSWEDLQKTIGGGEGFGQNYLSNLISSYWGGMGTALQDIDEYDIMSGWWGRG